MARKVIILADPGIDTAFALALAFYDPDIDVVALGATAGNVTAQQATRNVQIVLKQLDPPRWPRFGQAPDVVYDLDGTALHGTGGLGGFDWPCAELHNLKSSDKLIVDEVRMHPNDIMILTMGPLTVLARALDRDPEIARLVKQIVVVGGAYREAGNTNAVAEFHFYCDPLAAQGVLRCGAPIKLVPLDIMRKALFSPTDLAAMVSGTSPEYEFLRKILLFGVKATAMRYGIEGFHLKDAMGVCATALPQAFQTKPMTVDIETHGTLTRGMSVFDLRPTRHDPNVDLVTDVDFEAVRTYMFKIFATHV